MDGSVYCYISMTRIVLNELNESEFWFIYPIILTNLLEIWGLIFNRLFKVLRCVTKGYYSGKCNQLGDTMLQDSLDTIRPVKWKANHLSLLDQRTLPQTHEYINYTRSKDVADAITNMVVRGAPAIGITAAYAVVLAARARFDQDAENWRSNIEPDLEYLAASRPTAVNLFWAIDRMRRCLDSIVGNPVDILLKEAHAILAEDIAANKTMGDFGAELIGAELIDDSAGILTHCNAGALATGGYGTALGVIRSVFKAGKLKQVYADETRPWMQGSRLTAWELMQDNIPVILQSDSVAAQLMQQRKIDWVVVGSDRIAANGDVANKIGTYSLAVLAKYHDVKFMVAAPTSTIDMEMMEGKNIPIEQRPSSEVTSVGKSEIAASGVTAINPAFDVTPASLVDAIVTEKGVVQNPNREKMKKLMS